MLFTRYSNLIIHVCKFDCHLHAFYTYKPHRLYVVQCLHAIYTLFSVIYTLFTRYLHAIYTLFNVIYTLANYTPTIILEKYVQ